jgi:N-acetylmuramoyl-L-alanine amidase
MLKFFISLIFLTTLLVAQSSDKLLFERATKALQSQDNEQIERAFVDFKNLYLRSVINPDDRNNLVQILQGIIKAGKLTHQDTSFYESELRIALGNAPKTTPLPQKAKVKPKKVESSGIHKYVKHRVGDDFLELQFNYNINANQIKYFKLYDRNRKLYKYIFDIKSILPKHVKTIKHKRLYEVRLAQFDKQTIRLVLKSKTAIKLSYKRDSKSLVIVLHGKTATKKPTVIPKKEIKHIKRYSVVLDPGHGGKDGGTTGNSRKYLEKKVVLQIAHRVEKELKKSGFRVYMTRTKDKFIKLGKRTKFANAKKADLFISIHANAAPRKSLYKKLHGVETYFLSPARSKRAKSVAMKENSKDVDSMDYFAKNSFLNFLNREKILASNKLAIDIQRGMLGSLKKRYKVRDSGVREGPFWVLVGAQMPAVLIEVGYLTNAYEAKNLTSWRYQQTMAEGIVNGIVRYFKKNP